MSDTPTLRRLDSPEPGCTGDEHCWDAPLRVVGGDEEDPGVVGHGNGFSVNEVCLRCGVYRVIDTCADSEGHKTISTTYRDADKESLAQVLRCALWYRLIDALAARFDVDEIDEIESKHIDSRINNAAAIHALAAEIIPSARKRAEATTETEAAK